MRLCLRRFPRAIKAAACLAAGFFVSGSVHAQTFTNVTSASGITFLHNGFGLQDKFQGTGAAWFDFDGDGDLDVYLTRRIGANALYRNDDGLFVDVAVATRSDDAIHDGAGVAVADYNNDGWPDIYLANSDEDVLLRNNNGVSFSNVTAAAGLAALGDGRGTTASWGDYNGDGRLDIYVANHEHMDRLPGMQRDYLLRGNDDGTFTDVSLLIPATDREGYGFIGAWTDVDDDNDPDILLVNDCPLGPNPVRLFRNDGSDGGGGWKFSEASEMWGCDRCNAGMGLAIGDYDRDGRLDYFYTNIGNPILLHNEGVTFGLATGTAGINVGSLPSGYTRWTWGANFFDYDLDGWVDLYVASGGFRTLGSTDPSPNILLRNRGDGTFADLSTGSGADDINRSRTSVFGDYDGDGDADILVVNYEEPAQLYRNDIDNGNHFFIIELEGVVSNRDGIGARMRIRTPDGVHQYAERHSGTSLGGGDDLATYFGLGAEVVVEELLIRWPSGTVQRVENIAADQRLRFVEDAASFPSQIKSATAFLQGDEIVVQWNTRYEQKASLFEILLGSSAIDSIAAAGTTLRPGAYEYRMQDPLPGSYVFRVRLLNSDSISEESAPIEVVVPESPPPVPQGSSLSLASTNPFSTTMRFDLSVDSAQRVRVEVFDVAGRRVALIYDDVVSPGQTPEVGFDGAGRVAGVYLVKATGSTFTSQHKVMLIR